MVNKLPAETQLAVTGIQTLLRRIYSAEPVRNECGTVGEPVQKENLKTIDLKTITCQNPGTTSSYMAFQAHFAGMGTFHIRDRKSFVRKIRAKPSVPDSKEQLAVKKRFAEYIRASDRTLKNHIPGTRHLYCHML